jgi:hypothetical protein
MEAELTLHSRVPDQGSSGGATPCQPPKTQGWDLQASWGTSRADLGQAPFGVALLTIVFATVLEQTGVTAGVFPSSEKVTASHDEQRPVPAFWAVPLRYDRRCPRGICCHAAALSS